jgi:hypothetical protein
VTLSWNIPPAWDPFLYYFKFLTCSQPRVDTLDSIYLLNETPWTWNMGGLQILRVLQINNHLSKQTGLLTKKEEALKFKLFQITISKERLLSFRPCENSNCKLALSRFNSPKSTTLLRKVKPWQVTFAFATALPRSVPIQWEGLVVRKM